MTDIELTMNGSVARAKLTGTLTAGMVGVPVILQCDESWDGLKRTLVCRNGAVCVAVENVENRTTVAPAVLQWQELGDNELLLGLEGRDADGTLVMPSTMAFCGKIYPGAAGPLPATQTLEQGVQYVNTPETVIWHPCPQAMRRFLEEVTYDEQDATVSLADCYAPAEPTAEDSRPLGRTVGDRTFYHPVPNADTPFVAGEHFGKLCPQDSLRLIRCPTAVNVRDLGGWKCDGGTVKYGLLFRGGEPTAADRAVLVEELGIRHELNLRGAQEASWEVSPLGEDVRFVRSEGFNWYSLTDTEAWKTQLKCIFDGAIHREPVYFHCAAGADRAGTLACVVEGLLGVGRSDIDKDYELSCFYTGVGSDLQARRRNEADWQVLIGAINEKSGATFRDRCVTFVAELGFTDDQINAFRAAMIDGNPETVSAGMVRCAVENDLSFAHTDNDQSAVRAYLPYRAQISPHYGYVIRDVQVKMGGVNVTDRVWTGMETKLRHRVIVNAVYCSLGNGAKTVISGQSYAATVSAIAGYTLDGATISIKMGGMDMSSYYTNGVIAIEQVTGDLEITVVAVEQGEAYTNQIPLSVDANGDIFNEVGYLDDARLSSGLAEQSNAGSFITGFIPVKAGDVLRVYSGYMKVDHGNAGILNMGAYDGDKVAIGGCAMSTALNGEAMFSDIETDEQGYAVAFTVNPKWSFFDNWSDLAYLRLSMIGSGQKAVLTVNEQID